MNRIEELLLDRTTGDLSAEGEAELTELLRRHPAIDAEAYDRMAGELAASLAASDARDPLPDGLFRRLLEDGEAFVGQESRAPIDELARRRPWIAWSGWVAAAAAAVGWFVALDRAAPIVEPVAEPTVADVREGLVNRNADLLSWTATEDPSAETASGDVVWSDLEQAGVMRITGLEANDPTVSQYQLWIFDEARDERFPVDGGVFDIPGEGGDVLVPIRAAVPVTKATLFAVTVERPGGVVVSDRERIVLVAQAG
jgi:anti-sigma-K factor RskA